MNRTPHFERLICMGFYDTAQLIYPNIKSPDLSNHNVLRDYILKLRIYESLTHEIFEELDYEILRSLN